MIFTVTFNPSLDYIIGLEEFIEGEVNRSLWDQIYAGGKGINVSQVLKNLGISSVVLGFIGGFTGREIEKRVRDFGCDTDFVKLKSGHSRINIKIKSRRESEINGVGPDISKKEKEELFKKLDLIKAGDFLVLAGSIPPALSTSTYEKIMERLNHRGIKIIVDATEDLLVKVLKYRPFLIKPNKKELEDLSGQVLRSQEEIIGQAKKLKELGALNVLVSLAGEGAILIDEENRVHQRKAPGGQLINSVGAGDSMVAGFLAGYLKNKSYDQAFKWGLATGSASAFSEKLATAEEVVEILNSMNEKGG